MRPKSFRWISLSLWLVSAIAFATPPRPRDDYARGVALYQAGHFEEAIEAFRDAYQAKPRALILFNIGQAYRKDGKPAMALEYYQRYLAATPPGEDPATQAHARQLVGEIEARLNQLPPDVAKPKVETPVPSPAPTPTLVVTPPAPEATAEAKAEPASAPPEKTPLYKKWWLWTAVGAAAAVVIIVGVGVGVGTQSNEPSTALGTRQPEY
jgi:tetratricopeptide (TPR) repeat protein